MEVSEEPKQEKAKFIPIIALEGNENAELKKDDENKENKENEENKEKVESVVNIVQNQIINTNKKKKPRKVNFDL